MIDAELPATPDPATGMPRPPRAPELTASTATPTAAPADGRAPTDPARPQRWFHHSPEPILETVRGPRPHPVRFAARYPTYATLLLALPVGGYLGANVLRTPNFDLAGTVTGLGTIVVVLLGGYFVLNYLIHRYQVIYAGARWVGDGEGKDQSVTTYDLTHIMTTGSGTNTILLITGTNHVTLRLPLALLQSNPPLWDLLYNGLRHSAAGGAIIDPDCRRRLRLPPAQAPRS